MHGNVGNAGLEDSPSKQAQSVYKLLKQTQASYLIRNYYLQETISVLRKKSALRALTAKMIFAESTVPSIKPRRQQNNHRT
jgi:hypothetical protein